LVNLMNTIREEMDCTTLIISEVTNADKLSRFGIEEFVADNVIILHYFGADAKYARGLEVRKMRRTNHGTDIYPFKITNKGIVLIKPE